MINSEILHTFDKKEFTKILLLSESHRRPISDLSETEMPNLRLVLDMSLMGLRSGMSVSEGRGGL